MKTVGIIGGIAPESTIEYYRAIIRAFRERKQDGSYPSIIINSIDLQKILSLITANDLAAVAEYLLVELQRLARAGADFGVISSNTPHIVFDEVLSRSPIPLISIVEATCQAATTRGLERVGLFGTRFTMQGRFYSDVLARVGITLVLPDEAEQNYIHEHYMGEFIQGIFLPETRERLLAIAHRLAAEQGIEALILGGTELPLILTAASVEHVGIPFLDTSQIHVNAVVAELTQESSESVR